MPPSSLSIVLRWKPVAIRWSSVALGQQVAGELLDGELVERHVGVERLDHPVAVRPDRPRAVLLVAVGVGVAGQVEPAPGPALAVVRRGEQPVDQLLVGVRRRVVDERVDLRRASAAGRSGRGRRRRTSVYRSACGDGFRPSASSRARTKWSIGFFGQSRLLDRRQRGLLRRRRTPSGPCTRPPRRPTARRIAFCGGRERLLGRRRRHHLGLVVRRRCGGPARSRRACRARWRARPTWPCTALGRAVEPQLRLAGLVVRAVALEAVLRQDRPDVPGVVNGRGRRPAGRRPARRSAIRRASSATSSSAPASAVPAARTRARR